MREIVVLSLKLFIITAVSAFLLAFTNSVTKDRIAQQIQLENESAREEVISPSQDFEQVDQELIVDFEKQLSFENLDMVSEVFKDTVDGELIGYTFKVMPKGYGGEMALMVGISIEAKITGLQVISHGETPGLGAKIEEDIFRDQFKGKTIEESFTLVKGSSSGDNEVQAISGASVSSEAIVEGVNAAIEIFKEISK